jgi:hypothetical protein
MVDQQGAGADVGCPSCGRSVTIPGPAYRPPMSEPRTITCVCTHCSVSLEVSEYAVGVEIECPACHKKTILYTPELAPGPPSIPPVIPSPLPSKLPSGTTRKGDIETILDYCKNCQNPISQTDIYCPYCRQLHPNTSHPCPKCGADDFEIYIIEDHSSIWITPSFLGVLSAAVWSAIRPKTVSYLQCFHCGCQYGRRKHTTS